MATMVTSEPQTKSRRDRDKERKDKTQVQVSAPGDRLKTIVRRLPPNLPEGVFWQSVQAWVTEDTVTWKVYYLGKASKRCVGDISDQASLVSTPELGNEFQAVVEFAPYQKVPSDRKKVDARLGTIEKVASTQPAPMPTTTPLLEALKAEKSAAKDREAILRNHAHYKEIARGKRTRRKRLLRVKPPGKILPTWFLRLLVASEGKKAAINNEASKVPAAGPSQPQVATTSTQPPTAPRRMRLGLASRQFEAALSGVGVSRRRDREDKADPLAGEGPRDGVSDGTQTPMQATVPLTPRSPKRERRRKEDGASAGPGPNAAGVPGILQRIDAPQTQGNMNARIDAAPPPPNFGPPPRGGAPRGRGRGRGRGGPARGSG
ncbi:Smg-4/UPF3 family-domain-containing protein [Salix suchowensis]|nr:Smg-4/UPF3 family-domain-containing protein [Salix suchowensis]